MSTSKQKKQINNLQHPSHRARSAAIARSCGSCKPRKRSPAYAPRHPAPRMKVRGLGLAKLAKLAKLAEFCKFLAGSFSAVSKRNFARKYAFDSIFQALRDLHTFSPLQSQNFSIKKSISKIGKNLQIFANFWRARSRLYQNEILQENTRLTAFFKLYKICILLHRCNLKIFAKKIGLKNQQFL